MILSKSSFSRALLLCFPILWDSNYWCLVCLFVFFFFLDLNFEVKLPELLFHASIEEQTLMELQAHLLDFLRFQCFPPSFMLKLVIGDEFNWENNSFDSWHFTNKLWCITIHFTVQVLAKKPEHILPFYLSCCRRYWDQHQQTRLGLWTTIDFALYIDSQSCCWYRMLVTIAVYFFHQNDAKSDLLSVKLSFRNSMFPGYRECNFYGRKMLTDP